MGPSKYFKPPVPAPKADKKGGSWQYFCNDAKIREISENLATHKFPSIQYILHIVYGIKFLRNINKSK